MIGKGPTVIVSAYKIRAFGGTSTYKLLFYQLNEPRTSIVIADSDVSINGVSTGLYSRVCAGRSA